MYNGQKLYERRFAEAFAAYPECTDVKGYSTLGSDPWKEGYSRLDGG